MLNTMKIMVTYTYTPEVVANISALNNNFETILLTDNK